MNQLNEDDAELLSALADGRLEGDAFVKAVALASDTEEGRATWHAYHLVGDVLRSTELSHCSGDGDFLVRFRGRLATEPSRAPVLPLQTDRPAVVVRPLSDLDAPATGVAARRARGAGNMRWKLTAGLASVVAVAAISWQWLGSALVPVPAAQLAASGPTVPAASAGISAPGMSSTTALAQQASAAGQPVMLRDPRLDELLAAHRQFGGTSALQMPAGFLRNATFERPER